MGIQHSADAPTNARRAIDFEPRILELLEGRLVRRTHGPYQPLTNATVERKLRNLLCANGHSDSTITELARMAGGALKEQFCFTLITAEGRREKRVLRVVSLESIVETCRHREAEVLAALVSEFPVATVRFVDGDDLHLGQPGVITSFVPGVSKPPNSEQVVSGVGTVFTAEWRARLAPQFIANLCQLHALDWRAKHLPHFAAPIHFPTQAALWQVNWWSKVWHDDALAPDPLLTFAECWMRENLPSCAAPVLLHGDYRTGNFMFDPDHGSITAILDWELAQIGDFHEELGSIMQRLFAGAADGGNVYVCNLMTREDFMCDYPRVSGRQVNLRTLAFYEILNAYKCAVMNLGTGAGIAARGNNHQDSLLSFMASVGHTFEGEIARLLAEELDP